MTYADPTKKPCSDCPFRRASAPGWLGAGSPESFLDCIQRGEPLPCHQTIDYEDPDWLRKWSAQGGESDGRMCSGFLIFMANKMQAPRDKNFPRLPPDQAAVFSTSIEFVRHHREAAVRSWSDEEQADGALIHREIVKNAAERMGEPIVDFRDGRVTPAKRSRKPRRKGTRT